MLILLLLLRTANHYMLQYEKNQIGKAFPLQTLKLRNQLWKNKHYNLLFALLP